MSFDITTLLLLGAVGMLAGFVDAVAGGGGLIGIPALLSVGVPPVAALATNKMQSIVGTAVAAVTFWRKGLVSLRALVPAIVATFAGAYLGAFTVDQIDISALQLAVPIALIVLAAYFMFAPNLTDESKTARLSVSFFMPVMGFGIGFYDGLFGPGTGSFFMAAFVMLFGLGITRAAGHTKALNVVSNLAALAFFIPAGAVLWPAAIAMAIGQAIGGYLGALTGIRFGARLIKPLVVIIAVIMALRLLFAG